MNLIRMLPLLNINPGVKFGQWIQTNISALFIAGLAIFGFMALVKRKVMHAIVLIIIGGMGAVLVYNGSDVAKNIADLVTSWFKG